MRRVRGFTLVELAVVLAIVGLLLGSAMLTLGARVDQQNRGDTQRGLENARELLLSFAIVNGRLPCPATATSSGDEAPSGGGSCTTYHAGFLPARTIGFQPVDSAGFAIDAWGNRIRYAVSQGAGNPTGLTSCSAPTTPAFTSTVNLKANGVTCAPTNIVICNAAQNTTQTTTPPSCGTPAPNSADALPVTNQLVVAAVIFSTGKNGAIGTASTDEAQNTDGGGGTSGVYVHRSPNDTFDDQMVWLPVGVLYSRMIAAGVLP